MPAAAPPPRCPRCGYDLADIPPAWTTQCPLEGTCSECGRTFRWGDVFDPHRRARRWRFDDPEVRGRALLRAFVVTTRRPLIPWRFWNSVRLTDTVRWSRLAWLLTLWCATLYLLGIALLLGYTFLLTQMSPQLGTPASVDWALQAKQAAAWPMHYILRPEHGWPLICYLLTGTVLMLALRTDRYRHTLRAGVYGLVGPGLLMVVWFFIILTSLFLWLHPSWTPYRAMRFYTIGADLIHWLVIAWTLIWWTGVTCLYLRLRHWKTAALIAFTIALALAGLIYALWSAQLVKG
ncbi:MAG: hypothetical protein KDA21_12005 [Phycisphaerales bacterium]|nr:hypothetical protein [Phycisphaerales bacterium]